MGKPPWMRQTRVTADGETEFHDTGFLTSFLSIFIGLSMPRNPRKAFSMHRAVWWTVAWLALFAAFTAIQAWYTFQTRDSARMGEWYLHMFGITLAGDWWPIAVLPVLFGPGGRRVMDIGRRLQQSALDRRHRQCSRPAIHHQRIGRFHRTLRHVSDVRSACAGTDRFDHRPRSRAAVCLQLTADMDSRSHHRRHRPDACRNHGRCHWGEQRKAERHGDESSAHHRVRLILPGIRRIAHSNLHSACISAQQADQHPAGGIGVPDADRMDSRRNEVDTPLRRGTT